MITTTLDDPAGYGRVILDDAGNVAAIVEHKDANPEQLQVRVINSGIYCFRAKLLWKHIAEIKPNAASGELYLTDMAEILNRHGQRVQALHLDDSSELLGINTRIELAEADRILRARKARELMLAGVTIERPETVAIDAQVRIGTDTIIEPFARLLGNTAIGEDCRIGQGAILESADLADRVVVAPYTLIADSRIDPGAQVGPFARIRMQAQVGPEARVGNFVELKKTRLGAGAKSQHLAYLGDSEIGERVNIGRGHHHLQLRWREETRDQDRRRSLHRQQLDAGRAGRDRPGQLCRRRQRDYRSGAQPCARAGPRAPSE